MVSQVLPLMRVKVEKVNEERENKRYQSYME
jgi:hypothetical protein